MSTKPIKEERALTLHTKLKNIETFYGEAGYELLLDTLEEALKNAEEEYLKEYLKRKELETP